jgi:hypothetical protein
MSPRLAAFAGFLLAYSTFFLAGGIWAFPHSKDRDEKLGAEVLIIAGMLTLTAAVVLYRAAAH